MSWRVLKFGGTSVTAAPLAAAGIVAAAARERTFSRLRKA